MVHELKHSRKYIRNSKNYFVLHQPFFRFSELIHIVCCSRVTPAAQYVAHQQYVRQ